MIDATPVYGSVQQGHNKIAPYRDPGVMLPIVYPIHPECVNYLPDAASGVGIRRTIAALGDKGAESWQKEK